MQFVEQGPDIPDEILRAQEVGRLAFFCGAGISMKAGMPSFKGLVERVCAALHARRDKGEEVEFEAKSFDRVLNLLERRFGRPEVRQQVRNVLATPPNPFVDTHKALLILAAQKDGLHLVTTNFDRLFQEADPNCPSTAAPCLPVPKPNKWNSVVYLHGLFDDMSAAGDHLVLTSADFGVAYLIERWASRFVAELFNHFTVLFVGYSVSDPVMRYLVDAIAAERSVDARIQRAYALAGDDSDAAEWVSKGIAPIFYPHHNGHDLLHRTLNQWAHMWQAGLMSRANIISQIALRDPSTVSDVEVSQLCWAIENAPGALAYRLAELKEQKTVRWLDTFEARGLFRGSPAIGNDTLLALADDGRRRNASGRLDDARRGLAVWLSQHFDDDRVIRWAIKAGGHLHPELQDLIRGQLRARSGSLPDYATKIWLAISGSLPLAHPSDLGILDDLRRIENEAWSPLLRAELLAKLEPCIRLQPAWFTREDIGSLARENATSTVSDFLVPACELRAGAGLNRLLNALRGRHDAGGILAEAAFELTGLLRRSLDLLASLDGASEDGDLSYVSHPAIEPHPQNRHSQGWTHLIDLLRQSFDEIKKQPEQAAAQISLWRSIRYPVFRRLILWASRTSGLVDPSSLLQSMVERPDRWLWSPEVQFEVLASLHWLCNALKPRKRNALLSLILAGPPRERYSENLEPERWSQIRDRLVWERLARLNRDGADLTKRAAAELARIEKMHPGWNLTDEANEGFPVWTEIEIGPPPGVSGERLLEINDDELTQLLTGGTRSNHHDLFLAWRDAVQVSPGRAIRVLRRLQGRDPAAVVDAWRYALEACWALQGKLTRRAICAMLVTVPDFLLDDKEIVYPAAAAVSAISAGASRGAQARILRMIARLLPPSLSIAPVGTSNDKVQMAINHPAGRLTEAIISIVRSRSLKRDEGIPEDVRSLLEMILDAREGGARWARVIVAAQLPLLHDLDSEWAQARVLPLLDWSKPEAASAWQGFLCSPYSRPSLWQSLKPHFLEAFDHVGDLDQWQQTLAGLLANIAIEVDGAITPAEAADCLTKLGPEGCDSVLIWICRRLDGAQEKAGALWRERIQPWLGKSWPMETRFRTSRLSERLASVAILSGDSFAEAVGNVLGMIGPVEHAGHIVDTMEGKALDLQHPAACLDLVDALTPEPPHFIPYLGRLLDRLRQDQPSLVGNSAFRRLETIAIKSEGYSPPASQ